MSDLQINNKNIVFLENNWCEWCLGQILTIVYYIFPFISYFTEKWYKVTICDIYIIYIKIMLFENVQTVA